MGKDKILVHTCCAPCYSVAHNFIKEEFNNIFLFWFNPNIHPFTEYMERFNSVEKFCTANENIRLIQIHGYDIKKFIRSVSFREDLRCIYCYSSRLEMLGRIAKRSGFKVVTTSLLSSPFQKHDLIKEIGRSIEKKYKVKFYYEDFREFWKTREENIKKYDMYKQSYCGCIYSEEERYSREIKNLTKK